MQVIMNSNALFAIVKLQTNPRKPFAQNLHGTKELVSTVTKNRSSSDTRQQRNYTKQVARLPICFLLFLFFGFFLPLAS